MIYKMVFQRYELLHLILSCLRTGSKTAPDIAKATASETKNIYTRLESYRNYGNYVFKRQLPNKKRFIWSITNEGRKKLETLDIKFAPHKTAVIDLTVSPYNSYDKVVIKNGKETALELIPIKK